MFCIKVPPSWGYTTLRRCLQLRQNPPASWVPGLLTCAQLPPLLISREAVVALTYRTPNNVQTYAKPAG